MYVNCITWNTNMLSWGIISAPSWATNVSYQALTSVLLRTGICGFFSSTCRSMFASGEVAYTPSRYTVLLSCLSTNLARHGLVTADRAQPTCPKSLFIAIDKLRSPAFLLGYSWPFNPSSCNANVPSSSWRFSVYPWSRSSWSGPLDSAASSWPVFVSS